MSGFEVSMGGIQCWHCLGARNMEVEMNESF